MRAYDRPNHDSMTTTISNTILICCFIICIISVRNIITSITISIKQHTFPSACPPVETHGGCTSLRWCCSTSRGDISLGGPGSTTEGGRVEQDEARGSSFPSTAEGVCCSTSRSDTQTNIRTRKPRGSSFPRACMPRHFRQASRDTFARRKRREDSGGRCKQASEETRPLEPESDVVQGEMENSETRPLG